MPSSYRPSAPPFTDLASFLGALRCLYFPSSGSGGAEQAAAHKALQKFQRSHEAWALCSAVLQQGAAPPADQALWPTAQLFSAQTLHAKVRRRCLDTLEPEERRGLRVFLVQAVPHFAPHRALSTQLCLALAALAFRMRADWAAESILPDLAAAVRPAAALLPLLRVLPEQLGDVALSLAPSRRSEVGAALRAQGGLIEAQLQRALADAAASAGAGGAASAGSEDALVCASRVAQVLGAWVELGSLPLATLHSSGALQGVLSLLSSALSSDEAAWASPGGAALCVEAGEMLGAVAAKVSCEAAGPSPDPRRTL